MIQLKLTYEEAISVLKQYNSWRLGQPGVKSPKHKLVTEALKIAIDALQGIVDGKTDSDPSRIVLENIYNLCSQEFNTGNGQKGDEI